MKNVYDSQIVKCIIVEPEDYTSILRQLFGDDTSVEYTIDGIWVEKDRGRGPSIESNELHKRLAEHFDVSAVTSVHIDANDEFRVWICYKD